MTTSLEEITSGYHNDSNCKKYQEQRDIRFDKPCKFKDNPAEISKLLEKIVFVEETESAQDSSDSLDFHESDSDGSPQCKIFSHYILKIEFRALLSCT